MSDNAVHIPMNGLPTLPDCVKTYLHRVKANGYTLGEALGPDPVNAETKPAYDWLFSGNTTVNEDAFALEWLKRRSNV